MKIIQILLSQSEPGTPVVVAASTGPAWLIAHEQNCLLFPVDNVERCATGVTRLLQARNWPQNPYKTVPKSFSGNSIKQSLLSSIKRLFTELTTVQRAGKLITLYS